MTDRFFLNHFAFISETPFYAILAIVGSLLPSIGLALTALYSMPFAQSQVQRLALILPLIFILLTLALAAFFYRRSIVAKLRKGNEPRVRAGYVYELTGKISKNLGVKEPVLLLSDDEGINAAVFGGLRRKYLIVSRGLWKRAKHFPELAEAILTHELSHIRNGDVVAHEVVESIWKSLAVMIPVSWATWTVFAWLALNRADAPWLVFSVLWYAVPALAVFWLNGAISALREIRADLRTIELLRTEAPIRDVLGILSFTGSRSRVLERLRVIERGLSFRDFLKITFIASAIGALLAYGLTFPSPPPVHGFYWTPASSSLMLLIPCIFLPKHVVSRFAKATRSYTFFARILGDSLLIAVVSTIAKSLVDYFPFLALMALDQPSFTWLMELAGGPSAILFVIFYLVVQNFVVLIGCAMLVVVVYLLLSIRERIRGKILMPSLCVLIVILFSVSYRSAAAFFTMLMPLLLILLIVGLKYARCPYCGESRKINPFGIIRCTCSKVLNRGFFVFVED